MLMTGGIHIKPSITRKNSRQSFFVGSIILIASVFVTKAIGMLYRIPIAHILGGSGMAYFSSAYSIFMPVYAIAVSGIPPAVAKLTAGFCATGCYSDARRLRSAAITFFFFTGFSASIALIILSKPLCDYVIAEPMSRLSVAAIAPCIAIGAAASVERGYAEGMSNMIPTAVSEILEAAVKLAAGLGFAVITSRYADAQYLADGTVFGISCATAEEAHSASLPFIAAASVMGVTVSNACGCFYLWASRKLRGDGLPESDKAGVRRTPRSQLLKKLLNLVAPLALASVISTLSGVIDLATINRCLDRALSPDSLPDGLAKISASLSESERLSSFIYGSYSGLALTVFGIVPSLTAMFGRSILPSISACCAKDDRQLMKKSIGDVIILILLISVPCAMGISVFSNEILSLLFAGKSAEIAVSSNVLSVLGTAIVPVCLCALMFTVFQTADRPKEPIKITIVGCAVKLAANIILVSRPNLNIVGAGIATTLCYTVMLAMCSAKLKAMCGRNTVSMKSVMSIIIASVLSIECAYLLFALTRQRLGGSVSFVISAIFSVNIYILAARILSVLPKSLEKNKKHLSGY